MPSHGCRTIASTFNLIHSRKGMTVGKSFVAGVVRSHQLDILRYRRDLKHRKPRTVPKNLIWATDLTYINDDAGQRPLPVFGLIDHGTRACLRLQQLRTKLSVELLRQLLDAVESFDKSKILRTDNEAVFISVLFRTSLALLGIRHQLTTPEAPWQSGRIERFFGTFKDRIRQRASGSAQRTWIAATAGCVSGTTTHAPIITWTGERQP